MTERHVKAALPVETHHAIEAETVWKQAGLLALGLDAASVILRPSQPPQLLPNLLGCGAALLLFTPAVEAVRKLGAAREGEEKLQ